MTNFSLIWMYLMLGLILGEAALFREKQKKKRVGGLQYLIIIFLGPILAWIAVFNVMLKRL